MPSSEVPPEFTPKVKPFDPIVLDRALIAIPLLDQMKKDFELIELVKKRLPSFLDKYNSAIELNPAYRGGERRRLGQRSSDTEREQSESYPDGIEGAWLHARDLAKDSVKKVSAALIRKLNRFREEERSPEAIEAVRKDRREFLQTEKKQKILKPHRNTHFAFAILHAAVAARMLAANESLGERAEDRPITAILPHRFEIIIDLNLEYPGGREAARAWVEANLPNAKEQSGVRDDGQIVHGEKSRLNKQYLFARLEARAIHKLIELDLLHAAQLADERRAATSDPKMRSQITANRCRAIFHIWPDFEISACINKSIATVKANAAQASFSARGSGIVWAVADSGIDHTHQHFTPHANIDSKSQWHQDFTGDGGDPLFDENGHGTHVAGIIAGEWRAAPGSPEEALPLAVSRYRANGTNDVEYQETRLDHIAGMAPQCRLVSLKVLNEHGKGTASGLIAAITHVQEINGYGRRLLIHGVNMSLGYTFEPEWFACGQSPLCVEVDRLVKSGVVVVVAAGNTGYGVLKSSAGSVAAGMALTINDPGNADLAITVGATHRDMPHLYGVSYFSSKGPTGDGRLKPDLVAPGEKIISCATGNLRSEGAENRPCQYVETSGTSMAAPHVSGVIAAFLSVRPEFIGHAERVKEIFVSTATDLRRDRYFQGAGLIDLMRAIQSV